METEAPHVAERSDTTSPQLREHRLRTIFNNCEAVLPRDVDDRIHRRWPTGEMDGQHGFRSRCDGRRNRVRVEIHVIPDVDEDGARTQHRDRRSRRDERVGRSDHLVAGTNVERAEREDDCVRSGRHPHRIPRAAKLGEARLELLDLGPENELAVVEHSSDRVEQCLSERRVLADEIDVWDFGLARQNGPVKEGSGTSCGRPCPLATSSGRSIIRDAHATMSLARG